MAIPGIQEIQALAFKYSKSQLANMVQMGMLDPQKATMAGFMRDRIAKEDMKPPTTTVAQDALGIAPPQEQPMPPQGQQMPPQDAPMPEMAGLESLPAGNVGEYAGGGIVAFDDGGEVPGYKAGDLIDPEFRGGDPDKKARLQILRDELATAQGKLANPNLSKDDRSRVQSDIDAINREIASAGRSAKTSTAGFGDVTKIPQGDPRIAAQRDAMSLPAINPPTQDTPSSEDLVSKATGVAEQIYPKGEIPRELSIKDAFNLSNQALTEAGADLDFYTKQDKDLEKEGATFAKDREEAKTFRILQAAAGVLSGTSPFASVNIGKGVAPAVEGLASDLKDFNKNERALRDAQRKLKADQQQFNVTRASSAMNLVEKSKERVDRLAGKKADLIGDITKSFISTQGSKEVAEVYAKSYKDLEGMRQAAPPDIAKLADRLAKDMPNSNEKDRLEAASNILYPGRGLSSIIGAESTASKEIEKRFSDIVTINPKYKKMYEAALAGDPTAQQQIADLRNSISAEVYKNRPILSGKGGAETPPAATAPKTTAPPPEAVQQLRANDTPQMRAYFDQTFGQGAAARVLGK
jgi:hypothetical protein